MTSSPSEVGRITLEHVTFRYLEQSKRPVLDEVSASFDRSRITVLTGPSGCGKSTLLYLAAGIYPQNAGFLQGGTVRVEGQEPAALGPGERCALVGMLFQNPELQFCMDTVENELFFCLENRRVPRAEMEERLSAALDFCGIAHLRRRPLRSLSGGEKQRAALACLAAWGILPNMMEEYKRTRAAFAARGIRVFPVSPALLKPLLVKSVRWSEELSIAMESRGFDGRVPRTCSQPLRLRPVDVLFPILSCALFLALFFLLGR